MNKINIFRYFAFFVLIANTQNVYPFHVIQIRNESAEKVTITYCNIYREEEPGQEESIEIVEHSVKNVNLMVPEYMNPVSTHLENAENYLKIHTLQGIFLCAEGPRTDHPSNHYAIWIQQQPKLSKSQSDRPPAIRILKISSKPICITIDANGTIS